jgi:hypothetical protein
MNDLVVLSAARPSVEQQRIIAGLEFLCRKSGTDNAISFQKKEQG